MEKCQEEARQKEGKKRRWREREEVRRVEKKVMNAVLTANLVESITSGVLAAEVKAMGNVERGSCGALAEELFQHVNQCWDCSQVENEPKERDVMDWVMDYDMIRQWEEVSKKRREVYGEEK